jgi:hypothetical protein
MMMMRAWGEEGGTRRGFQTDASGDMFFFSLSLVCAGKDDKINEAATATAATWSRGYFRRPFLEPSVRGAAWLADKKKPIYLILTVRLRAPVDMGPSVRAARAIHRRGAGRGTARQPNTGVGPDATRTGDRCGGNGKHKLFLFPSFFLFGLRVCDMRNPTLAGDGQIHSCSHLNPNNYYPLLTLLVPTHTQWTTSFFNIFYPIDYLHPPHTLSSSFL